VTRSLPCRRILLTLGLIASFAACSDAPPPLDTGASGDDAHAVEIQALSCTADVRANVVSCGPGTPAADGPEDGPSHVILNPTGYVSLTSSNFSFAGGLNTFDVTVQSLYPQTLSVATSTSGRYDGAGVRVFFTQPPVATEGTGIITVNGAETGKFTRAGQLFYRYPQTLRTGQTSAPRQWSFSVPPTVVRFEFSVLVAASVQYPRGWVEITGAPALRVARSGSLGLAAVVRDALGRDITASAGPVSWTLADSSVATITGSTLQGAATSGYTTLTATAGPMMPAQTLLLVGRPFTQIAAGGNHTCGVDPVGQAWCWGLNSNGEIGDSTYQVFRVTPVAVKHGATRFVEIQTGAGHTCARTAAGQAFCWGKNEDGQLGDGATYLSRYDPIAVQQGATRYVRLALGHRHTCALSDANRAWCWGSNQDGQLGDSTNNSAYTPVRVRRGTTQFADLTAGALHNCARTFGGQALCWGRNDNGQLGNGKLFPLNAPGTVRQGTVHYAAIGTGRHHSCGVSAAGSAYCWGWNEYGQIGDGTFTRQTLPVAVQQGTSTYVELDGGEIHTCARTASGVAWCWGIDENGQLGDGIPGDPRPFAARVLQGSTRFVQITAGAYHTCGLTRAGQAWCWGRNGAGTLGDSTRIDRDKPVPVK
jgi:alpha-tubulin suppressor-like RCC1 family protein